MSGGGSFERPPLPQVVHVMSAYRKHGGALAVGGVTSAARTIANLDPRHRLVVVRDGDRLDELTDRRLEIDQPLFHLHHALAVEALPERARFIKTLHVLQRRQSRMRGANEVTKSEARQVEVLRRAQRVTVATECCRAMLLEDHPEIGDLEERLVVLPLVPPEPIARRPMTSRSRPRVVALGRFDKLKGTPTLVEVVGLLMRQHPDLEVVVAGGLPDHPKYERRWLEAFRKAIPEDSTDRFNFVGWLPESAVADLLASAALLLAPSRLETCGLAVMEAMAAGCPIVANDIAAHREVAREAAHYVDDAGSMVEAATTILSSPSLWARLSAAGPRLLPDRAAVRAQWLHFWEQTR